MDPAFNWQSPARQAPSFKIETTRNLGWWVLLALLFSVIVHVCLYVALGELEWFKGGPAEADDIVWKNHGDQLVVDKDKLQELLPEPDLPKPEPIEPEKLSDLPMVDKSLDEFDLMERMKDKEVKLTPEVDSAKIFSNEKVAIARPNTPAVVAEAMQINASELLGKDLKEMREKLLESSAVSADQPIMALDADEVTKGLDTDKFFKDAAAKAFGNDAGKFMEGYNTLDGLIGATGGNLPPGEEKILMPTDILFEYNEWELKEAARLSMMKLAFIVQTNEKAQFVIEGHTDTFGTDEYNMDLSKKRAGAVRDWLMERLQIGAKNIKAVGYGRGRPIVNPNGSIEEQSLNRRVEIVIRN
ncbi:MAG: OmpA family protein [Akkermansiaceae bacterium]|nr:OmpA family protein [Akkermansiaceae bacterium]MCP5549608.1 OmpA family protein [Akkermansiaceae bacterium]